MNIAKAGALIRSASNEIPLCKSEEHKEIGLKEKCILPICGSKEYNTIGVKQDCLPPVCGSENHRSIGLRSKCTSPICNSKDHKTVGLDRACVPICNSKAHKQKGLDKDCRYLVDETTFVSGSSVANAWMYDGDIWNDIKPMSIPRERAACSLVQTDNGVSKVILLIKYPIELISSIF